MVTLRPNDASPASDISNVKAVTSDPPSLPLKTISLSDTRDLSVRLSLSISTWPTFVLPSLNITCSPAASRTMSTAPSNVILPEDKAIVVPSMLKSSMFIPALIVSVELAVIALAIVTPLSPSVIWAVSVPLTILLNTTSLSACPLVTSFNCVVIFAIFLLALPASSALKTISPPRSSFAGEPESLSIKRLGPADVPAWVLFKWKSADVLVPVTFPAVIEDKLRPTSATWVRIISGVSGSAPKFIVAPSVLKVRGPAISTRVLALISTIGATISISPSATMSNSLSAPECMYISLFLNSILDEPFSSTSMSSPNSSIYALPSIYKSLNSFPLCPKLAVSSALG